MGTWGGLMLVLGAAAGCHEPAEPDWRILFGSDRLRGATVRIAATIHQRACDGPLVYEESLTRDGATPARPPELGPGHYAFLAVAYDDACRVLAQTCVEVDLPRRDAIFQTFIEAPESAPVCSRAELCVAGVCVPPRDGGVAPRDVDERDVEERDVDEGDVDLPAPDACLRSESACGDRVDDDCDGTVDCVDLDCRGVAPCPACSLATECDDGIACTEDVCAVTVGRCMNTPPRGGCVVAGACVELGAIDGDDVCRVCDSMADPTGWTVRCAGYAADDTFEDLRDGSLGRSEANLYVHAGGTVRQTVTSDVNGDGRPDIVAPSTADLGESSVYLGSATGFAATARLGVNAGPAQAGLSADLDADGDVDLFFVGDGGLAALLRANGSGFDVVERTLETGSSSNVAGADLNRDGWLDVVIPVHRDAAGGYVAQSFVYWGSPTGFRPSARLELPTRGALDACLGDVTGDGFLDVVFTQFYDGGSYAQPVVIYRGSPAGPTLADPISLAHSAGYHCSLADVDKNGHLDIAVASFRDADERSTSRVFLGSATGFATSEAYVTIWATGTAIADFDRNGVLDVAFGRFRSASPPYQYAVPSAVFLRDAMGMSTSIGLPTAACVGLSANDSDLDGHWDLLATDGRSAPGVVRVFTGSPGGLDGARVVTLPSSVATVAGSPTDLGNTFDRSWEERFESRVHDGGEPRAWTRLEVIAEVPAGTMLSARVRSAPTEAELAAARYLGPAGEMSRYDVGRGAVVDLGAGHVGHRYVQYELTFTIPGAIRGPVVDAVRVYHR